uniref:Si:ch211-119d14.3 n=1 Tax=Nothobranchius rachovii TaxID=451742 RepID=A0A1A8NSI5_9TELE
MDDHASLCAAPEEESKFHITIQKGMSLPRLKKCSCCPTPLYHCPFCVTEVFKPTRQSKLRSHMNGHMRRAFFFDDYTIHRCALGCRKQQHFHCLYCSATILRRCDIKNHLSICFKKHMQSSPTPGHEKSSLLPTQKQGSVTSTQLSCPRSPSNSPSPAASMQDSSPVSPTLGPISETSSLASFPPSPSTLFQFQENRKIDVLALMEYLHSAAGIVGPGPSPVSAATHRQCSIELKNDTSDYTLYYPSVYLNSGCCSVPFPPTIRSSTSGEASFTTTPNTTQGSVGIFTYDLFNNSTRSSTEKAAVLFVVPTDLNSVAYAVGIFDHSKECGQDLFKEMFKTTKGSFVRAKAQGQSLTHKGRNVTIMATMSNCSNAVMKVEISETNF